MKRTGMLSGRHSGELQGWPRPRLPPSSCPTHGPAQSLLCSSRRPVTLGLLGPALKGRLRRTGSVVPLKQIPVSGPSPHGSPPSDPGQVKHRQDCLPETPLPLMRASTADRAPEGGPESGGSKTVTRVSEEELWVTCWGRKREVGSGPFPSSQEYSGLT